MPKSEVKVSELVSVIGGELHGDPDLVIEKFTSFEKACPGDAVFVSKRINLKKIFDSPATLLVINQDQQEKQFFLLVNVNIYHKLFRLCLFVQQP